VIDVTTLTDGGQRAEDIAARLVAFVDGAQETLDLALYSVRLAGPVGDHVAGALRAAHERGVAVRLLYNVDEMRRVPIPPPPQTRPELLEALPIQTRGIGGIPDLMHHKYIVRDGADVWSGSTNWSLDSWQREENVLVTVDSAAVAAEFGVNFTELWGEAESRRSVVVERSGRGDPDPKVVGDAEVRVWFSPGHGPALSHRIAKAIGEARTRVRVASPVITSGPIIGTLAEVIADERVDVAGVVDATQVRQVFGQWRENPRSTWKIPLLERILAGDVFTGKRSTPWSPDSVHDFMHAKVTIADDTVFVGSFNLSHSGERNAENVLEIADPGVAAELAAFIDGVRARYEPLDAGATP